MKIGYIRVSTQEQNTIRQEVMMKELGVEELYIDKASGKNTDRPELKKMMAYVRRGDTVIVESISRFARNTRDLLNLMEQLPVRIAGNTPPWKATMGMESGPKFQYSAPVGSITNVLRFIRLGDRKSVV